MTRNRTIAVFGATGAQGGGVVKALQEHGGFRVRALTRNPGTASGLADEVIAADLTAPETLETALDGAYGVFANTNSFAGPDVDEVAQGTAAVEAAKAAGVEHYIWSTLPNVEEISGGTYNVAHFTNKAKVNAVVEAAGFRYHSFTEPPFYFQNLTSPLYEAAPGANGTPTWRQPMSADSRGIHLGDIDQYGKVVVGAFDQPSAAGSGQYLSFAGDLLSWDDVVSTLQEQGHDVAYTQTDEDPYGLRDMFAYFEEYTYFGPHAEGKIALANRISPEPPTNFRTWAAANMRPAG